MTGGGPAPLILTLGLEAPAMDRLEALRRAHFPAALNRIPAHLTLFHHLPGGVAGAVAAEIERAARATPGFDVAFTGLRKLGRGVALKVRSQALTTLRAGLAARFADELTAQDRQGFRPHVTIQNKVEPREAAALFDRLSAEFEPWTARAERLLLWRYLGGPWEAVDGWPFGYSPCFPN